MEGADAAAARGVAERLLESLAVPVDLGDSVQSVRASIGLAEAMPGAVNSEETLRNADVAMYWAKDRGKGTLAVYEAGLHAEALERVALRGELAARHPRRAAGAALPADGRPGHPAGQRLRGTGALGPPDPGAAAPVGVHPGRRAERSHRAPRQLGPARGLPGRGRHAGRATASLDGRQRRRAAAGEERLRRRGRPGPPRHRSARRPAGPGDHRERGARRHGGLHRVPGPAARRSVSGSRSTTSAPATARCPTSHSSPSTSSRSTSPSSTGSRAGTSTPPWSRRSS